MALTGLALAALQLSTTLLPSQVAEAQSAGGIGGDYPVPGGWFYTQEASMFAPIQGRSRGYIVEDNNEASFWTEFRRYGDLAVLGYPVSQRYHYPAGSKDGPVYQAFERGILQWQPDIDPNLAARGIGHAEMANVMEQFTEQFLDGQLEFLGIPKPTQLPVPPPTNDETLAKERELRMSWLAEPRFQARYLFDPVRSHSSEPGRPGEAAFNTQEQAWSFFGLPQTSPERLTLMDRPDGHKQYPLYQSYLAQRFQKGGLELPLGDGSDVLLSQTLVPGDGRKGCVALTAVGLLARTIGLDKMIPADKVDPFPPVTPEEFVTFYIPATSTSTLQFKMAGTGFVAGESIQIVGTPVVAPPTNTPTGTPPANPARSFTSQVDQAASNGSFEVVSPVVQVGLYDITFTGAKSAKPLTMLNVSLATSNIAIAQSSVSSSCQDVGVAIWP